MQNLKIMAIVIFLFVSSVLAADLLVELDLANYPAPFISNDRLDTIFIVGEFANSDDVLALAEIAASLQVELQEQIFENTGKNNTNIFEIDIKGNPQDELTKLYMDVLNKNRTKAAKTMLDTSLDLEDIKDQNIILVGGPCVNWVSAHFRDNPENCAKGFAQGRAYLQLFRNGKGTVLMIAGFSADDTRRAARILANHNDFSVNMAGEKLRISSAWIEEIKIT